MIELDLNTTGLCIIIYLCLFSERCLFCSDACVFFTELQNCVFIWDPAQDQLDCQNATVNAGAYSGFRLHLSGSEATPAASAPTSREVGL
jgi:hypothetical protein